MKTRISLRWKILAWFFLNLAVIAVALLLFLRSQFRLGLDSLLAGPTGQRLESAALPLAEVLPTLKESEWGDALERLAGGWRARGVAVLLVRNDGHVVAGDELELPAQVREAVENYDRSRRGGGPGHGPGFKHGGKPPPEMLRMDPGDLFFGPFGDMPESPSPKSGPKRQPKQPAAMTPAFLPAPMTKFIVPGNAPWRYWAGVHLDSAPGAAPLPATLLFASPSLRGGGLFFDYAPWLWIGAGLLVLSTLIWLPFVHRLTRVVGDLTQNAEQIAQGNFSPPPETRRRDELGRLNEAHRHMAARLDGQATQQRRFLGDTAHELLSPLARLEVALSILEQRAQEADRAHLERALGEVHHISALVHDLLSFTKAGMRRNVELRAVELRPLAEELISQEKAEGVVFHLAIPSGLAAQADAALLRRALSNVLRNAARYAAHGGPVEVRAEGSGQAVMLSVRDAGPGVPADALPRLFDPFYRPDTARTRETGGTGLGLAIVKNCVEACGGSVAARNREPHGLEIEMTLQAAGGEAGH